MLKLDAKMSIMRTTIRIDDALYRDVKQKAAGSGRTVAAVLEDAVRVGLQPQLANPEPYRVHAGGRGGLRPGIDLSDNSTIAEAIDDQVPLDALR
jgi:Arc/MetJ family transcription regulator